MTERPRLQISWKDYATFPADAIVNSSNQGLVLGSNVSHRIQQVADPQLASELQAMIASRGEPLALGEVVHTAAFGVGAPGVTKWLLHAATLGVRKHPTDVDRVLATPESICLAAGNAVALADDLGCETVMMPIMAARPGYSTLICDPNVLRWSVATALVLGVRLALTQVSTVKTVFISAWSPDGRYQDQDVQMLRALTSENSGEVHTAPFLDLAKGVRRP